MISVAESLSEIQAAGKAFPGVDAVVVKENQLTENKEHQELPSLMAEGGEQKEKLDWYIKEVVRLNLENEKLKAGQRIQEDQVSVTDGLPDDLPVRECRQIKENLKFLKDELVPERFIAHLFSNGVLNNQLREYLMQVLNNHGKSKCTESLLHILLHKCSDTRAYDQFCQCLLRERYYHALKKLEPNWPDITHEQLQKSRGKLPDKEYSLIQDHMEALKEDLLPNGYITHLFSMGILTQEDCEELEAVKINKGNTACVEAMLFRLLGCGMFGLKEFLKYLIEENPSLLKILYPADEKIGLSVKFKNVNHEVVSDTESIMYIEFTDRATGNVEELLCGPTVKVLVVKPGCVEIAFEVHSLGKTDKRKLQEVVENAMESGYIGTDAISKIELIPMDDDKLTDEEVEKEIKMFEAEIVRLNKEHQRLLEIEDEQLKSLCLRRETRDELVKEVARLNREIKTLKADWRIQENVVDVTVKLTYEEEKIKMFEAEIVRLYKEHQRLLEIDKLTYEEVEKDIKMFEAEIARLKKERQRLLEIERTEGEKLKSFLTTSREYNSSLQKVIGNRRAIADTLEGESRELKAEAQVLAAVRVASTVGVVGGIVGAFFTLGLSLAIATAGASALAGTSFLQKVLERSKVKEIDRMFEKDNSFQPCLADLEEMFYTKYNSIVLVRFREIIIKIFKGSKELAQIIDENDRKSRELLGVDSTHNVGGYVFLNMPLLNSIKEFLDFFTITTESKLAEKFLKLAVDIKDNLTRADILAKELTQLDDELSRLTYVKIYYYDE